MYDQTAYSCLNDAFSITHGKRVWHVTQYLRDVADVLCPKTFCPKTFCEQLSLVTLHVLEAPLLHDLLFVKHLTFTWMDIFSVMCPYFSDFFFFFNCVCFFIYCAQTMPQKCFQKCTVDIMAPSPWTVHLYHYHSWLETDGLAGNTLCSFLRVSALGPSLQLDQLWPQRWIEQL